MANVIIPMDTNLVSTDKTAELKASLEYDASGSGASTSNKMPLINLEAITSFDQMETFLVSVAAGELDYNLWEATSELLRARTVIIECTYGGGGIVINPEGAPIKFPLSADATAGNGWFMYTNPSGNGLIVDVGGAPTPTGPGIDKITVDTEVESRFKVYVFV